METTAQMKERVGFLAYKVSDLSDKNREALVFVLAENIRLEYEVKRLREGLKAANLKFQEIYEWAGPCSAYSPEMGQITARVLAGSLAIENLLEDK